MNVFNECTNETEAFRIERLNSATYACAILLQFSRKYLLKYYFLFFNDKENYQISMILIV